MADVTAGTTGTGGAGRERAARMLAEAHGAAALAEAAEELAAVEAGDGRAEAAWFALIEAVRWFREAGDGARADADEDQAARLFAVAFPPFAGEAEQEPAMDRLLAALADAEAWTGIAGDPAVAEVARIAWRARLRATAQMPVPPTRLARLVAALGLAPGEAEVVALLHRLETDAGWDRKLRAAGREEYLPGPTVRFLGRFLGGGRLGWAELELLLPASPLARCGAIEIQDRDGRPAPDPGVLVRLAPEVLAFLSGADLAGTLAAAGLPARVEPRTGPLAVAVAEWAAGPASPVLAVITDSPRSALAETAAGIAPSPLVLAGDALVAGRPSAVRARLCARLYRTVAAIVLDAGSRTARGDDEPRSTTGDGGDRVATLAGWLAAVPGPAIVIASPGDEAELAQGVPGVTLVRAARPGADALAVALSAALARLGVPAPGEAALRAVVTSEAVGPDDIDGLAREIAARGGAPDAALRRAARARSTAIFHGVAERLVSGAGWGDLVLPQDVLVTLNDVITFARYRDRVLEGWGFAEKMPYGRALTVLFHGPPGTGKTLAACVLGNELGVDVFRVDLSQIVSKWIGETEKNLARVFDAASRSRALLLFDEADSLFGRRTEVRAAVDRYANLEVNFLLQRLEDFDGVAVLTTNSPELLDNAFRRRIRFKVAFPAPDAALRASLWRALMPSRMPLADEIDADELAESFDFSGAHVRNAVLRAAFRAASEDRGVSMDDLRRAARDEAREAGLLVRGPGK